MTQAVNIDLDLLRRHDLPGPRYTSYPTAPQFTTAFDEVRYRQAALASNAEPIPADLSLYVHVPFCTSPCFFCACTRVITRDRSRGGVHLARLLREIDVTAPLFDRDREVRQLHLGGGTPNFLTAGEIGRLLEALAARFRFSDRPDRDFSIELDPRVVERGEIARLAGLGFNRASLGVQDFDSRVQRAVNRVQTVEQTLAVIDECRAAGVRSVNVDLIYGLPQQTIEGFGRTLETLVSVRPDRLAVYGYAHLPDMFKPQRQIDAADLPAPALRLALLQLAVQTLTRAGYRYVGMDHFALPADQLSRAQDAGALHRNFMGYTVHGDCDLIGLGMSAIGCIGASYSQNLRDLPAWERAVDAGRLPIWRGIVLDADDLLRSDIIQALMCTGEVDMAGVEADHGIEFPRYFADALERLAPLAADGLVEVRGTRIRATASGRLLLRVIAMCFDRYLESSRPARFSRVI